MLLLDIGIITISFIQRSCIFHTAWTKCNYYQMCGIIKIFIHLIAVQNVLSFLYNKKRGKEGKKFVIIFCSQGFYSPYCLRFETYIP